MKTYFLVCKAKTDNVNSKVIKTKNGRLLLLPQCPVCKNRKARFKKNDQQAKGLLSSLGIKTPLSNVTGLNILF